MPPHRALLQLQRKHLRGIIRDCIAHTPGLSNQQITLAKSLAGHMVAGTAEPEEVTQFNQLLHDIEPKKQG
jgi:hypothetical protein